MATDYGYDPFTPPAVSADYREQHAPDTALYAPGHDDAAKARSRDTITKAYTEDAPDTEAKRVASRAQAWRYDGELEKMDRLRSADPAAFSKMPVGSKMALGYYLDGRQAAVDAGLNVSGA